MDSPILKIDYDWDIGEARASEASMFCPELGPGSLGHFNLSRSRIHSSCQYSVRGLNQELKDTLPRNCYPAPQAGPVNPTTAPAESSLARIATMRREAQTPRS